MFFYQLLSPFYSLENTELIVLGNQKSGTTAITKLLAECIDKPALLDHPLLWEPNLTRFANGEESLKNVINSNKYIFSRPVVKEPNLTFLFTDLQKIYPDSVRYLFIVRNPFDNIRSLLNSINLPGNLSNIDEYLPTFSMHESILFDKKVQQYFSDHYIDQMAERWNIATNLYLTHQQEMVLIKYEDFCKDKVTYIEALARQLGYPVKKDISGIADVQYQPRGTREVNLAEFFGSENLEKIRMTCSENMRKLGYH